MLAHARAECREVSVGQGPACTVGFNSGTRVVLVVVSSLARWPGSRRNVLKRRRKAAPSRIFKSFYSGKASEARPVNDSREG